MFVLFTLFLGQLVDTPHFSLTDQRQAIQAVLRISDYSGGIVTVGTGAVVGHTSDGMLVLTAHHVVAPGQLLTFEAFPYQDTTVAVDVGYDEIEVVASDPDADVSLLFLRTNFRTGKYFEVASRVTVGSRFVLSVGCSHGNPPSCELDLAKGMRLRSVNRAVPMIVTHRLPVSGRSGGPLVDHRGRLIGICRGGLDETDLLPACGHYVGSQVIQRLIGEAQPTREGEAVQVVALTDESTAR